MSVGVRTRFFEIIERFTVTRLPAGVCGWCRHPRALHREGRPCQADDCLCLRMDEVRERRR